MGQTFWDPEWLAANVLNKINRWEYGRWNDLTTGSEISHVYFEDIRKRLWLLDGHHLAGQKPITETYESWMQIKWAYGDATELIDRQYADADGNIVTLEEGQTRWNVTNSAAQLGYQIADLTASIVDPGDLVFWDGDFTPTAEGSEYIPPLLFTASNGTAGYTNGNSLTPPIDRETGVFNTTYYALMPDPNYYHDWDPNAQTYLCGHWSEYLGAPREQHYNTVIPAHRYLPVCTDPKEQDWPLHCFDSSGGSWIWQIKDKVEIRQAILNNLPHISHYITDDVEDCRGDYLDHTGYDLLCRWAGAEGPATYMQSQNFGGSDSCNNYWGMYPYPPTTPYGLQGGHPPTAWNVRARKYEIADKEAWSEPKYDESYAAQISRVLEQHSNYYYPVNDDYINSWMLRNNTYDDASGTYTYGGSSPTDGTWDPLHNSEQSEYAMATDELWGCNGSHQELVLKVLGEEHYLWVLDFNSNTTFQHHDMIRGWWKGRFCGWSLEDLNTLYPWSTFCWRRIPRWAAGRYDKDSQDRWILYWAPELGTPPGHVENDARMPITQAMWDAMGDTGYRERYYRVVDLGAMFEEYFEKVGQYKEGTDFSEWGINYLDVPSTPSGLSWIDDNWEGGQRLPHPDNPSQTISHEAFVAYYTHPIEIARRDRGTYIERSMKYEMRAEHLQHMRHMLMVPRYYQIEPTYQISTCGTGGSNMIKGWGGLKPLGQIGGPYPTLCGGIVSDTAEEAVDLAIGICESIRKSPPPNTEAFENQTVYYDLGVTYNSQYQFWDYGQPRSWSSVWSAPGYGAVSDVGGWFAISKSYDYWAWTHPKELCGRDRGGCAVWDIHRSDACIVVPSNDLLPVGATLHLRMYTWCVNTGYWLPMPFECLGETIYPGEGIETHWLSVGVNPGGDSPWYYIKHLEGWTAQHRATYLSIYSPTTWFFSWDMDPPDSVWQRRTIKHHDIDDCSIYPDWMRGEDPEAAHDSDGDGNPDHKSPRDWRDDSHNDTPEFDEEPHVDDDGSW